MTLSGTSRAALQPFFWEEFVPGQPYAGRDLAALRGGWEHEPGTVAAMRSLHRVRRTDSDRAQGQVTASFAAEHTALVLFAVHQGATGRAHQQHIGLGTACRRLVLAGAVPDAGGRRDLSDVGLERLLAGAAAGRRLANAATAEDVDELAHHLRALVGLLRQAGIGLDYTRLFHDLRSWPGPRRGRTVRAWGLQYADRVGTRAPGPGPSVGAADRTAPAAGPRPGDGPFWERYDARVQAAGGALAALRSGVSREAGAVPALWLHYRAKVSAVQQQEGFLGRELAAEHAALALFGMHQQGRVEPMHVKGRSPGSACRLLLARDPKADRIAVERFFGVLVTSVDAGELAHHLGALVRRLRQPGIGLDYTGLAQALVDWDHPWRPDEQSRIRARWDHDFRVPLPVPSAQP